MRHELWRSHRRSRALAIDLDWSMLSGTGVRVHVGAVRDIDDGHQALAVVNTVADAVSAAPCRVLARQWSSGEGSSSRSSAHLGWITHAGGAGAQHHVATTRSAT